MEVLFQDLVWQLQCMGACDSLRSIIVSLMKRNFFPSWDVQALQGNVAVKEDALGKGAQTHQLLQAETNCLRKAYEQERDTVHLLQQDKTAVTSKLKAKEQVRFCVP